MNVTRPTPAAAERVAALIDAYGAAHGAPPDATADDLRDEWRDLDLERDAWLLDLDGRLVGYACVYGRGQERLDTDGYVDPGCTGRGIGAEILRLAEARARERGAVRLHNAALHCDEAGRALFAANGYAFVRAFLRMAIDLTEPPPEPVVPDGLRLEPFDPADERPLHAAIEEAFQDHWEHVPRDFESWARRRAGSDRTLWRVVKDGDELAGVAVNDRKRFGAGWIGTVATRRPWRGRGVAHALLLASFGEFHRRGERTVALAVDASNPTGAVRLYERVGMHTRWRADVYEKRLA